MFPISCRLRVLVLICVLYSCMFFIFPALCLIYSYSVLLCLFDFFSFVTFLGFLYCSSLIVFLVMVVGMAVTVMKTIPETTARYAVGATFE